MILSDTSLDTLAQNGLVHPYNFLHVQPCSIDLTIGNKILVESLDMNGDGWVEIDITKPYELRPGQFILATTAETLEMPNNICGQIALRSSAARAGWDHCLSGWIDSGFEGQITLELRNNKQLSNLTIQSGMRLLQVICFQLNKPSARSYAGSYQCQQGVQPSNLNFNSIS